MNPSSPPGGNLDWGLQLADEAAGRLGRRSQIDAICVLGSVARGEAHPGSDVDLMLIADRPMQSSTLRPILSGLEMISLIVHTRESFRKLSESRTIFAMHVRDEGKILLDRHSWLSEHLDSLAGQRADPSLTYRWARREIEHYRNLARFNGIYHFAFARLYSISRAVAIGVTVDQGDPQYGKDAPFEWVAARFPALTGPVQRLSDLRPFREIDGGYDQLPPPFDDRGAHSEMRQAMADLEALLSSADELETDSARGL